MRFALKQTTTSNHGAKSPSRARHSFTGLCLTRFGNILCAGRDRVASTSMLSALPRGLQDKAHRASSTGFEDELG